MACINVPILYFLPLEPLYRYVIIRVYFHCYFNILSKAECLELKLFIYSFIYLFIYFILFLFFFTPLTPHTILLFNVYKLYLPPLLFNVYKLYLPPLITFLPPEPHCKYLIAKHISFILNYLLEL